jgi:hypothetical protein
MAAPVYLPVEILTRIIWFMIPDHNYLAYPASHITTKTLLTLLTVSRATSRAAKALLYTHCLYIDTPWRLDSLLTTSLAKPCPHVPVSCIQNLYLAPFPGRTIRDRKIIKQITELFILLGPSLKRLVIDMPLRSHYPEEDVIDRLRPILRHGFEQLVHLEEFSSVKDELYLAYWDPGSHDVIPDPEDDEFDAFEHRLNDFMFQGWTNLRSLALYNCFLEDGFGTALACMPMLERVVLSRPDYDEEESLWSDDIATLFGNRVQFTVVDATEDATMAGLQKLTGTDLAPDIRPDVWRYNVPMDKDDDPIVAVQSWSLEHMLDGSLWSLSDLADIPTDSHNEVRPG